MTILLTSNNHGIPVIYWDFYEHYVWEFVLQCAKAGNGINQSHIDDLTSNVNSEASGEIASKISVGLENLAEIYQSDKPFPDLVTRDEYIKHQNVLNHFLKWIRISFGFKLFNSNKWRMVNI